MHGKCSFSVDSRILLLRLVLLFFYIMLISPFRLTALAKLKTIYILKRVVEGQNYHYDTIELQQNLPPFRIRCIPVEFKNFPWPRASLKPGSIYPMPCFRHLMTMSLSSFDDVYSSTDEVASPQTSFGVRSSRF